MRYPLPLLDRRGNLVDWSPLVWFCFSVVICLGLFVGALSVRSNGETDQSLVVKVYCASAAVEPMKRIVDRFNLSEFAISKNIVAEITRAGGSGALAGQISTEALTGVQHMADIFVCADSNRISNLKTKNVIADSFPVAAQFPVIAVRENSDLNLNSVDDLSSLLKLQIKIGVGSEASAIGFETVRLAKIQNCSDLLLARKPAEFENVVSMAQALSIGSVDAVIVWDSTVHQFNQSANRPIKILTYLKSKFPEPNSVAQNRPESVASVNSNFPPNQHSDKFSLAKSDFDTQSACFVEVGRSNSISPQADQFYHYLKRNRDLVLADFIVAGFSNSPMESLPNNGR